MANKLKKIGILGGPGSGKSTVAQLLSELGCAVINADKLNHSVLERENIISQVVAIWGKDIVDSNGKIDRKKLGRKVFSDNNELARLEKIVHPEIFILMDEHIRNHEQSQKVKAIVFDVPLLLEKGLEQKCDILIFVKVKDDIRRHRLKKSRNWDDNFIKKVENSQILLDNKEKISDYIVENSSDIPSLRLQLERIFPEMI